MLTLWYFDADPIGSTPEHIYTGSNADAAFEALCDRFGAHLFELEAFHYELNVLGAGMVLPLPADSRVAVIKH